MLPASNVSVPLAVVMRTTESRPAKDLDPARIVALEVSPCAMLPEKAQWLEAASIKVKTTCPFLVEAATLPSATSIPAVKTFVDKEVVAKAVLTPT